MLATALLFSVGAPALGAPEPTPAPAAAGIEPAAAGIEPAAAGIEVDAVGAWTIAELRSPRRRPDGQPTTDACGYTRDVIVRRDDPPAATPAVLVVACDTGPDGLPIPATPTLRLPPPFAPSTTTPTTTSTTTSTTTRVCAAGETPSMKAGRASCVAAPPPRPCARGEQPKTTAQLATGESPCTEVTIERGVPLLKGELTSLGDVVLINSRTSFGVGLGLNVIDDVAYAVVRPDLNLQFGKFELGLGAPLRFELLRFKGIDLLGGDPVGDATGNAGRFRTEDWDQLEDIVRPLRYVSWGKKEDQLYVDLNRVHASTIGHGQLVRRYNPNLDLDEDNLFAQVDGYGTYGGVELMAGPFPLPRLLGGLVFIKPLAIVNAFVPFATDNSALAVLARSWSIGFSYVTDLNSPTGLQTRQNPADQRTQLIVDAANQFTWKNRNNPIGDVVQGIGVDTEVKVLKVGSVLDLKVYGDYSHLIFPGDSSSAAAFGPFSGGGATVGGLLRVSFGETPVLAMDDEDDETRAGRKARQQKAAHGLRARLEARTFAPTYLPSYWNTMYEVDRFQFGFNANRITLPTKIRSLADQASDPWRVGYAAELSYAFVDVIGATVAFEDAYPLGGDNPVRGKNLALHLETKGLGLLQLFGTYHFRNFEAADLKHLVSFNSDNEIVFVGGRVQLLPIMFVNVGAQRAFRVAFSPDDVVTPDSSGNRYTSIGLQNAWTYGLDVELGWQF